MAPSPEDAAAVIARRRAAVRSLTFAVPWLAIGCAGPHPSETTEHTANPPPIETAAPASSTIAPAPPAARPQLDGRAFPEKVLALTWDDGPDAHTIELARYLHDAHVAATFFVVAAWRAGISNEPGAGAHVFDTGYERLAVLGDLVHLGHRLANHTKNHVILSDADAATVAAQLRENQASIDRWITNDLRLFRAPGGAWNAAASAAVEADPITRRLIGPIRWDVDGKDWESSLYCRADHPAIDCEPAAPGGRPRVKPAVVARRYLSAIESAGRGIVLFHDRVGHVGSRYALDVARLVIPELVAHGWVFAAPVLAFSPLAPHAADLAAPADGADVDGDGKPDRCAAAAGHIDCAVSRGKHAAEPWSGDPDLAAAEAIRFGDVNGDGRADVCGRTRAGVVCAFSTGHAFTRSSTWIPAGALEAAGVESASLRLADVNGDGRADLCGRGAAGVVCGLAP